MTLLVYLPSCSCHYFSSCLYDWNIAPKLQNITFHLLELFIPSPKFVAFGSWHIGIVCAVYNGGDHALEESTGWGNVIR